MKQKYNIAKDRVKGFIRPRSRQSVLATPSPSPSATHGQDISITPSVAEIASQAPISPRANATPSDDDASALEAPASVPSPQAEHTSNAAEAYTLLRFEPPTRATTRGVGSQVAESTQDVNELGSQRQEVDEDKLMKRQKKPITTGQDLFSPRAFGGITYTLWFSQCGLTRRQALSITTAIPFPLWAMERS